MINPSMQLLHRHLISTSICKEMTVVGVDCKNIVCFLVSFLCKYARRAKPDCKNGEKQICTIHVGHSTCFHSPVSTIKVAPLQSPADLAFGWRRSINAAFAHRRSLSSFLPPPYCKDHLEAKMRLDSCIECPTSSIRSPFRCYRIPTVWTTPLRHRPICQLTLHSS